MHDLKAQAQAWLDNRRQLLATQREWLKHGMRFCLPLGAVKLSSLPPDLLEEVKALMTPEELRPNPR